MALRLRDLLKLLFVFLLMMSYQKGAALPQEEQQQFIDSFVRHYECNPEGRYAHEYHPFLLSWTSKSLHELEDHLRQRDLELKGRIVIMGYEENAVPAYYTNFCQPVIDDEAIRKNYAGWSQRLHNRFGFMTGFLFKDLDFFKPYLSPSCQSIFHHYDVNTIPIFNDDASIFQEHAFGQALPLIRQAQESLIKKLCNDGPQEVLTDMVSFWKKLYSDEFAVGDKQLAGTQDVLFSIEYAKYLTNSPLPLFSFCIGPDLTYPIEVTAKQNQHATLHAQHFVGELTKKLTPINGQNTVYVFCSFVDGVGKSTMLGNIKNWMKWGGAVDSYGHVDNSSSQLADLFQFSDNVFIADLPAQISHFTYKPDGQVFADIKTAFKAAAIKKLESFVDNNRDQLWQEACQMHGAVAAIIAQQGYTAPELNDPAKPLYSFVKNIILLKKRESNLWIPFEYEGKPYLFKDSKPLEIRFLTPLGSVKSEGLKNIEADQMLFYEGIRLPLPYDLFKQDLVDKLKARNIANVVFVDFLSMYPRSSRENIRINYLLQQMNLLDDTLDPAMSFYKDFVSGGELLYALTHKRSAQQIKQFFTSEAKIRLTLFEAIIERSHGDIGGIGMLPLTNTIKDKLQRFELNAYVDTLSGQKLAAETEKLIKLYGLSKSFINIQQFSFARAAAFGGLLQDLFVNVVDNETIAALWQMPKGQLQLSTNLTSEGERVQEVLMTDKQEAINNYFIFRPTCKNEHLLTPFLRSIRACWYASIFNLLPGSVGSDDTITLDRELFLINPLMLVSGDDGFFYVLQHHYPVWEKRIVPFTMRANYRPFNVSASTSAYSTINEYAYRSDWESKATSTGIFNYDNQYIVTQDNQATQNNYYDDEKNIVSLTVEQYQKDHGASTVITSTQLWRLLQENVMWLEDMKDWHRCIQRNGMFSTDQLFCPKAVKADDDHARLIYFGTSYKKYGARDEHRGIMQLIVRLFATLEMIIKDPDSSIAVRYGNKEDFKAALHLIEKTILPRYANICFPDSLFFDYDDVQPYPSWEFWQGVEG